VSIMANRWLRVAATALVVYVSGATMCDAEQGGQAAAPPLYLQIGPVVTVHPEGEQYHRASPALTGTTFGAAAAVGVRLAPVLAVEIEALLGGKLSGPQSDVYNYITEYTAESRDIVLGMNLRFRSPGRVRLELAAGGGMALSRFARRDVVSTDLFGRGGTTRGPDRETSTHEPTVAGSVAVAIPVGEKLELVPAVGARWIRRSFDTEAWYLGVGRYQVFASASLRVTRQ
jgi:hypothetical protein